MVDQNAAFEIHEEHKDSPRRLLHACGLLVSLRALGGPERGFRDPRRTRGFTKGSAERTGPPLSVLSCPSWTSLLAGPQSRIMGFGSGRSAAWLARSVRDAEVGGSNPLAPTIFVHLIQAGADYYEQQEFPFFHPILVNPFPLLCRLFLFLLQPFLAGIPPRIPGDPLGSGNTLFPGYDSVGRDTAGGRRGS